MKSRNSKDTYIWTECFGCGEILPPMIESFLYHHDTKIHVIGTKKDFESINYLHDERVVRVELEKVDFKTYKKVLKGYKNGHAGTSEIWSWLFRNREERFYIHLDADTVFLENVTIEIIKKLKSEGYALVGSRRPYKYRTYRLEGWDKKLLDRLPDVVNTDCFGFDKKFISNAPNWLLKRRIFGKRELTIPIIDFFDPISFNILRNGGKIFYMDSPLAGRSGKTNFNSDFHQKRISFSAVGSGCNFYKNPAAKSSEGYMKYALSSYSLFANSLLNFKIDYPLLNDPEIIEKIKRLDKSTWSLK